MAVIPQPDYAPDHPQRRFLRRHVILGTLLLTLLLGGLAASMLLPAAPVQAANLDITVTAPATTPEEGEPVVFTVQLSASPAGEVTINYETQNSTPVSAEAGVDYEARSGSLVFAAGTTDLQQTVSITTTENPVYSDGREIGFNFVITSVNAPGDTINTSLPITTQGNIKDDDPPPQVEVNDVTVNPEGDTGTKTVAIDVDFDRPSDFVTRVTYQLEPCTEPDPDSGIDQCATEDEDFILDPTAGELIFGINETKKTISLVVNGDLKPEANEELTLRFGGLDPDITDGFVGDKSEITVTILNDDLPIVGFAQATYDVIEAEGPVNVDVTLNFPYFEPVRVQYFTQRIDDSATSAQPGADYTEIGETQLIFQPGEITKTIPVNIRNDSILEQNDESFRIRLGTPLENAEFDTSPDPERPSVAIITIEDDDDLPGFSVQDIDISEGDAGETTNQRFLIRLTPQSITPVSVDYQIVDISATPGEDYIITAEQGAAGSFTFEPGETQKEVSFSVLGNDEDTLNRQFAINLSNATPTDVVNIGQGQAIATIIDDDGPVVSFAPPLEQQVEENIEDPFIKFTVQLDETSPQTVTVPYAINPAQSSATENIDFIRTGELIQFAPGEQEKEFTLISVLDDTQSEDDEQVQLLLQTPPEMRATLGEQITSTLLILDDEAVPRFSLDSATYTITENISTTASLVFSVTMNLNALPENRTQDISVLVSTESLTATEDIDYTFSERRISFGTLEDVPDSFPLPLTRTIVLSAEVLPDLVIESPEQFRLHLSNPIGGRLGSPQEAIVTIFDQMPRGTVYLPLLRMPPSAQFTSIANTVNEAAGSAVFEVELTSPPQTQATVRYMTTDQGTAMAGVDYVATTGVLTFTAGTTETQQFEVPILNNNNPGATSLIVLLSDPQGDVQLAPAGSIATLVILDNDGLSLNQRSDHQRAVPGSNPMPPAQESPWGMSSLLLPAFGVLSLGSWLLRRRQHRE